MSCPRVTNEQSVTITPHNGAYFTVYDIVMGLGEIIDCWKNLAYKLRGDFLDIPITVGEPTIRSYQDGHLILQFPIEGIY